MPLGDEKINTLDGQEIDRETLVQKMIDYYNDKYPDSKITDFNEGSEIRNLLEAIAVDIFHLELNNQQILTASFLSTSYGSYLDLFGEELNTPRTIGTSAWGTVTFSISEPVTYPITIPMYTTLVSSETGLFYNTNMDCEIAIGETSVDCPAYSQVPGANTNAKENTINTFLNTPPSPLLTVTNNEAFTEGKDTESDVDYRKRLLQVKGQDSFGSLEYYTRIGTRIPGVHDVLLVDSENDYTANVLVNGNTKPLDQDILARVTGVYTNAKNLVYNHTFEVNEVDYTTVDLELTAVVTDEVEDQLFIDALNCFVDGGDIFISNTEIVYSGININKPITNYQLLTVLEKLPFVVQVTNLTSDGSTFNTLTPDTNEVLKLGTITITQQVAE